MQDIKTFGDFIRYGLLYEYTEDYYEMNRCFLEMDAIALRLETCAFITENSGLSEQDLGMLMLESADDETVNELMGMYCESMTGILGGISNIFRTIGKAISNAFRNVTSIFREKETTVSEQQKQAEEISKAIADINSVQLDQFKQRVDNNEEPTFLQSAKSAVDGIKGLVDSFASVTTGKNQIDTSDIPKSSITILDDKFNEITHAEIKKDHMKLAQLLSQPEYSVYCTELIANMDEAKSVLNDVLTVIKKDGEVDAGNTLYRTFFNLKKSSGGIQFIATKLNAAQKKIEKMHSMQQKFTFNEVNLNRCAKDAFELSELFNTLASWSNVGDVDSGGGIGDMLSRGILKPKIQRNNARTAKAAFNTAFNTDRKNYGHNKAYWTKEYNRFLMMVYRFAVTMQKIMSSTLKVLQDHIQIRRKAIEIQADIIKACGEVVKTAKAA